MPFGLVLDGQLLAAPVVREMHLDYLAPGRHWADFSVPTAAGTQRFRVAVWLRPGMEMYFVLVQRPGRPVQLRQSKGPVLPHGYPAWAPGPDDYGYYQGQSPNDDYDGGYPPTQPDGPSYPAPGGNYLQPISPRDLAELTQALNRCPFDDQRLDIAHQALNRSSLRATKLAALVRTMIFDKSQKELAKFGYAHVSDPQNFCRVYDAFTFPLSAREMRQEIGLPRR